MSNLIIFLIKNKLTLLWFLNHWLIPYGSVCGLLNMWKFPAKLKRIYILLSWLHHYINVRLVPWQIYSAIQLYSPGSINYWWWDVEVFNYNSLFLFEVLPFLLHGLWLLDKTTNNWWNFQEWVHQIIPFLSLLIVLTLALSSVNLAFPKSFSFMLPPSFSFNPHLYIWSSFRAVTPFNGILSPGSSLSN